ncbi:MAG: hypothetical protein Kow0037_29930 [Calditrichia bacterium]
MEELLSSLGQLTCREIDYHLSKTDTTGAIRALLNLCNTNYITGGALYSPDGKPLFAVGERPDFLPQLTDSLQFRWSEDQSRLLFVKKCRHKQFLYISSLSTPMADDLNLIRFHILSFGFLIMLGTLVIIFFYTPLLLKPIRNLVKGAREVSSGNLGYRFKIDHNDEFGELGKSFNGMLDAFQKMHSQLEASNQLLEKRVKERTLELQKEIEIRRKEEEKTRHFNSFLEQIIEYLPDATFVIDQNRKVIAWNKAMVRLTGVSEEEIRCKQDSQYSRAIYGQSRQMLIDYALRGETPPVEEFNSLTMRDSALVADGFLKNRITGEPLYLMAIAAPILNEQGEIIGAVQTFRDLSDLKESERERMLLAIAIDQADNGIIITDKKGRFEYVNPAFLKLSGYTFSEIRGKSVTLLASEKHPPSFYLQMRRTIFSGAPWSGEITHKKKNGEEFTAFLSISPIRDARGQITNFVAVHRDITEQKELEEQLRQSQKMEAIGRLAGGVAHDFNNLLTVISGYSDMLSFMTQSDKKLHQYALEIQKAAERAGNLTNQLLIFSRKQVSQPQHANLNEIVENLQKMLSRLIGEDIDFQLNLSDSPLPVWVDVGHIEQVLMNLVVNARDAMPDGGRLQICSRKTHRKAIPVPPEDDKAEWFAVLEVSDTGIGMDAQTMRKIFEPFFTTKGLGKGTGLGLSTVYGIVQQSRGSIHVESQPGLGTTFFVYLPLSEEEPVQTSEKNGSRHYRGKSDVTILVVEDEKFVRQLTASILQNRGYQVLSAGGAEEALEIARQTEKIDILLADVILPEMNGKTISDKISETHPKVQTIFMSGYTQEQVAKRGVYQEEHYYIQKPFRPTDLLAKIDTVLRNNGSSR